jgi:SpoVK/Ycf46/Vps4 family AAA+-type ATPase
VVFVNNALDLLAGFVGQTSPKVDEKVEEARGGVLFIDEAYSIVKSDKYQKDSFGQEAIDCIMKHLDPPSCVFIFAGYEKPMEEFLGTNPGMSRRVPYRYTFDAYSDKHLIEIMLVMCKAKGEDLDHGVLEALPGLLGRFDDRQKQEQNAGLINNWVSFAQGERDDRIDIEEAYHNPDLASLLCKCDFADAIDNLRKAR